MPNWINSGDSGWIWKTQRKKREKQQVYLVSSSREKGVWDIERGVFASRHRDNQIHPYRNREWYAWQGSKEEQGRSDVRQSPIKSETGDIWRQTIETIPKDSLYRSCNKGGRSLTKFPAESPLGGVFVVKVAAGQVTW